MSDPLVMLSSLGKHVMTMDMFPVFFFAHFAIGNITVRTDSKQLGPKFRQKHPFVTWFCALITSLSGVFVANLLFGDPILAVLQENFLIGYLTLIWYLMNFSPFDFFYKVVTHPAVIIPVCVLQEFLRLRFLYLGVQTAAKLYPNAPLIIMVGGIIKGNGYGWIKVFERLVRGNWNPKTNDILELSYFAKSGVIASFLFLLHLYKVITVPIEFLYLGIVVAFIVGRLVLMIGGVKDPLAPLEAPFSRLLFGSWEDEKPTKEDLKEIGTKAEGNANKETKNDKKNGDKKTN